MDNMQVIANSLEGEATLQDGFCISTPASDVAFPVDSAINVETAAPELDAGTQIPSLHHIPQLASPPAINVVQPMHLSSPILSRKPDLGTHLVAEKWLSKDEMKQLEQEGLTIKKGKFAPTEDGQIKAAILNYYNTQGLSDEDIGKLIFSKSQKSGLFWSNIAKAVPQRTVAAVYKRVHRLYNPYKQQGKWTIYEDKILMQAVKDLGRIWKNVSKRVGRTGDDCRDRYRHLIDREQCNNGRWSTEEESLLSKTVESMIKDNAGPISWGNVSQQIGNIRTAKQCKEKWTDSLSLFNKTTGERLNWTPRDAYTLIQKVSSLEVQEEGDIRWNTLLDENWNHWSGHLLQKRWAFLKSKIDNSGRMAHRQIVQNLQSLYPEPLAPYQRFKQANTSSHHDSDLEAGSSQSVI